jgi:hypothetical protein
MGRWCKINVKKTGCKYVNQIELIWDMVQGQGWFWIPKQYTALLNSYRMLKEDPIPWSEPMKLICWMEDNHKEIISLVSNLSKFESSTFQI